MGKMPLVGITRAMDSTLKGGIECWGNKKEWKLETINAKNRACLVKLAHYGTPILYLYNFAWAKSDEKIVVLDGDVIRLDNGGNVAILPSGAYSPSDRDAINSVFHLSGLNFRVSCSGRKMHFI